MENLDEQIKREKREYFKNWRQHNKARIKEINKRYWEKRAVENQKIGKDDNRDGNNSKSGK